MAVSSIDLQLQLQQLLPHPVNVIPIRELITQEKCVSPDNCFTRVEENEPDCPFDCCRKGLMEKYFPNCEIVTNTIEMRIGLVENMNSNRDNREIPIMQKKTIFEGRVPGPVRFDELLKMNVVEGIPRDEEILRVERNDMQLTYHNLQLTPQTPKGQGQVLSQSPPRPPHHPWEIDDRGNIKWTSGQMEVTTMTDVTGRQRTTPDCRIPVMEVISKPFSGSSPSGSGLPPRNEKTRAEGDFIDQQLHSHLKSLKYVKPAQQQVIDSEKKIAASRGTPPAFSGTVVRKVSKSPNSSYKSDFSNKGMLSNIQAKSKGIARKVNPQHQISTPANYPRMGFDSYDRVRKYWEYHSGINQPNIPEGYQSNYVANTYQNQNYSETGGSNVIPYQGTPPAGQGQQIRAQNNSVYPNAPAYPYSQFPHLRQPNQTYQSPSRQWGQTYHGQGTLDPNTPASSSSYPYSQQQRMSYGPTYFPASAPTPPVSQSQSQAPSQTHFQGYPSQVPSRSSSVPHDWGFNALKAHLLNDQKSPPTIMPGPSPISAHHIQGGANVRELSGSDNESPDIVLMDMDRSTTVHTSSILKNMSTGVPRIQGPQKMVHTKPSQPQPTTTAGVIHTINTRDAEINKIFNFQKRSDPDHQKLPEGLVSIMADSVLQPTDLSMPNKGNREGTPSVIVKERRRSFEVLQRPNSRGSSDIKYDHVVLLDKRVMTYMCKRCLETLKGEVEIRNHLFCKMLQNSIQCHICRNVFAADDYPEHLRGHGITSSRNNSN